MLQGTGYERDMSMTSRLGLLLVATLVGTGACASTPTGPSVMALPGGSKSYDQFRGDDARCRQAAAAELQETAPGAVSEQRRYDMAYMQCMFAAGHQIPIPGGGLRSVGPAPAEAPKPPAGAPPPPPPGPVR
jgi:hypothetical protein